jgi:predicted site-specific integrase-resolvase
MSDFLSRDSLGTKSCPYRSASKKHCFATIKTNQKTMVANIITVDDLQAFKHEFMEELVNVLEQRQTTPARKWLKSHEVRRLLGVSPNTLQSLREKGTLPYTKIGGVIYHDFEDIKKMLEEHKTKPRVRGEALPGEKPLANRQRL